MKERTILKFLSPYYTMRETHRITNARHNMKSIIFHKERLYYTMNIYIFVLDLRWGLLDNSSHFHFEYQHVVI